MDAATIQGKIYAGRGKAALRIGLPCQVYRPAAVDSPLSQLITIVPAAFNAVDPNYLKANAFGKPLWYADMDGRLTKPGDYLIRVSDGAVWFIAAQQQLLPVLTVDCQRRVYISRPPQTNCSTVGLVAYSSVSTAAQILGTPDSAWPASILMGGRVQASTGLPSGVREAAWSVLLPVSVPITIKAGDLMFDDLERRFAVESAEFTDLGWRMICTEVHT